MQSVSDIGGQKVLGMGGSLTGYINTGNQYDKNYYTKKTKKDTFENKNSNKKGVFKKVLIGALIAGGCVLGIYTGKKTNLFSKAKDALSGAAKSVKNGSKAKEGIQNKTNSEGIFGSIKKYFSPEAKAQRQFERKERAIVRNTERKYQKKAAKDAQKVNKADLKKVQTEQSKKLKDFQAETEKKFKEQYENKTLSKKSPIDRFKEFFKKNNNPHIDTNV